jgi:hypothetical protein
MHNAHNLGKAKKNMLILTFLVKSVDLSSQFDKLIWHS